jgi:5-methyltetrahydropteroyltriglutamate--homocysteine methyltransferase
MKRSEARILNTHTGSLPRPSDLAELILTREQGQPIDEAAFKQRAREAVHEVVARQAEIGLDVINDGEMSKPSYSTYVKDRLSGFDGESRPPRGGLVEAEDFPGYVRQVAPPQSRVRFPTAWAVSIARGFGRTSC